MMNPAVHFRGNLADLIGCYIGLMKNVKKPSNQELRTRKDLLLAAGRLVKRGIKPTIDEIAKEAMVSRATAYRHFGSAEAILMEVPIDEAVEDPERIFEGNFSEDPAARVDEAEAHMHRVVYENEGLLRIMLAGSIGREVEDPSVPRRQNRRTPLIEAALSTSRKRFADEEYDRLLAALAMIFGPESMIVCRDVLGLDEARAREVKSWAVRALVEAASSGGASGK